MLFLSPVVFALALSIGGPAPTKPVASPVPKVLTLTEFQAANKVGKDPLFFRDVLGAPAKLEMAAENVVVAYWEIINKEIGFVYVIKAAFIVEGEEAKCIMCRETKLAYDLKFCESDSSNGSDVS
jgi:hypothetical protein